MIIIIPTPDRSFMTIYLKVVKINVPLLIVINILDREGLIANIITNKLEEGEAWSIPIIRRGGHICTLIGN